MQADRNEPGLTLHEARSLRHERQGFGLLFRLSLDDGNLGDRLLIDLDLRHSDLLS